MSVMVAIKKKERGAEAPPPSEECARRTLQYAIRGTQPHQLFSTVLRRGFSGFRLPWNS